MCNVAASQQWGTTWNGDGGRTLLEGEVAVFNTSTAHRCAYAAARLFAGVRAWRVEVRGRIEPFVSSRERDYDARRCGASSCLLQFGQG